MTSNHNTPLESLAAFAIAFAAGVVSTIGLGMYIGKLKREIKLADGSGQIRRD
ncbi:hypothetical protein ACKI2N_000510 [Cupriavidus sp. 30B13]|uniref:hypothetical protein n=1 Tax=Cupriavidus sp. 30B13 TaxID=3384241 RepID=UPI003B8F06B3